MVKSEDPTPFLGSRAATVLVILVLLGFSGVVAFSVIDRTKASSLESFSQTTAVGDTHYYEVPLVQLAVPEPVLTWQGRPWAPASYEKVKISDTDMVRLGQDEATQFRVYRERGKPADSPIYLKIDVSEYLRLVPR